MGAVIFISVILTLVITVFALVASYQKKSRTIAQETGYVSDRDILLHLQSPAGNYSTVSELAAHFGISKRRMKRRLSPLRLQLVIRQYGSGVTPNYTLGEDLPDHPPTHLNASLDLDLLKSLFEKYDYAISMAQIIFETGHSILDLIKFLKPYMASKTVRRVQDMYSDRRYVLAAEHRNSAEAREVVIVSDENLELEVLEFARLHNGKVTIEDLVREKHMARQEAKLKLEDLQRKELLQLALDDLGRPEFILTNSH